MNLRLVVLIGLVAALGFPVFYYLVGYPWHLALIAAAAIGAFVYSVLRAVERMREQMGKPLSRRPKRPQS